MRSLKLVEHNPKWISDYEIEAGKLRQMLSGIVISTYHIGSTAIAGIKAKPVIDILVEVSCLDDLETMHDQFRKIGYEPKGDYGIKGRRFYQKGGDERTHHVHIYKTGNSEIKRHRLFVSFMKEHPDKAAEYEALKMALSIQYKDSSDSYSRGKSEFIKSVDDEAAKSKNS